MATDSVTVTTIPSIPTSVSVDKTAICSGASVSLSATCATGVVTWYSQETDGDAIGTETDLSQNPTENTTYYATCKDGDCESSRVATNEVAVSALPANPTDVLVDKTAICSGTSVSLSATCESGMITWYSQETDGDAIGTETDLSQRPTENITYYASCKEGTCESGRVATSEVAVAATPANPTSVSVDKTSVCNGASVSLVGTCATGVITWYTQDIDGVAIGTGTRLNHSPAENTIYYAACKNGSCESAKVATNEVSVLTVPVPDGISVDKTSVLSGAKISLSATCSDGSVIWYTQQSGGSEIRIGNSLPYFPSKTTTFYANCRNNICESQRVATETVSVISMPQLPYLLKDINQGEMGSNPNYLVDFNGTVFFNAYSADYGQEPWKTDGTMDGTILVNNIGPGSSDSYPQKFIREGNLLFFQADGSGTELWVSNGETGETRKVKQLNIMGEPTGKPIAGLNGEVFFTAMDDAHGIELWKSNGTDEGTSLVKDIREGSESSEPMQLTTANGILFFTADDGVHGRVLWKSDGTLNGTLVVKDVDAGNGALDPENLINVGGILYFIAQDGTGRKLWRSDGTENGTYGIDGFYDNESPVWIRLITQMNGTLFIIVRNANGGEDLWRSGGSEISTQKVRTISNGDTGSEIKKIVVMNNTLYFIANDGSHGSELWKSNGLADGTFLVKDIREDGDGSTDYDLIGVDSTLYFTANDGIHGNILWKSDGTEEGTTFVKDNSNEPTALSPGMFINAKGKLYFTAEVQSEAYTTASELWSLGTCTDANKIVSTTGKTSHFNSQKQVINETKICHCDVFNNLISTIDSVGVNPVSGSISAKVWLEETAPEGYVRRHYEINPASGDTTATGKVTLYFTQADFDAYNSIIEAGARKLPADSADTEGVANLFVRKYSGISSNGTGLPDTYAGDSPFINPDDTDIVWNSASQRWEVSFATTGFGGFFVKSLELKEPTDIKVSSLSICVGLSISLEATCEVGTVTWYNTASEGSVIGTSSPVWFNPTETTSYYVACESGEFSGARILADTVTVNALPLSPTDVQADKASVCLGGVVTLTATCPAGKVLWYTHFSGRPAISMGTSIIVTPVSTTKYYASCKNNNCESPKVETSQIVVTAETIESPTGVAVNNSQVCSGQSVILTANCSTGTITWYNQATSGSAIGTENSLIQIPTEATTYYASCKNGSCETPRIEISPVIVLALPLVPTGVSVNKTIVTNGQSVLLTAACGSGSVLWYNQPSGGSALLIGSSSVHYPSTTATYYATCKIGNCESNRVATSQLVVVAMEQLPYIVKNINADQNSAPIHFTNVNGILYFVATDGIHGNELWKTDGTETGTKRITDINTEGDSEIDNITSVNGTIYFTVKTEIFFELWKTNGSEEGTEKVKDISEEFEIQEVTSLRAVNNTLYFIVSNSSDHITQLWTSDGSANGTVKVKDINQEGAKLNLNEAVVINNALFFQGNKIASGTELWKLENGNAGIVLEINDIGRYDVPTLPIEVNEIGSSYPKNLTDVKGVLYFTADDGIHGRELWRYDGSMEGSYLVKDIKEGIESSTPDNLTNVNGVLYFTADNGTNGLELWKTDGTNAGTVLVKDIASDEGSGNPKSITNVNGTVYFVAYSDEGNRELWKTDGTSDSTILVKDINPGGEPSSIEYLTNVNGKLYFVADDGVNGTELWTSNGTEAGTVMVKDIYPGIEGSNLANLFNVNGKLYFSARTRLDDIDYWNELWSLGTCAIDNTLANRTGRTEHFNQATQPGSDLFTCHCDVYNHLMTTAKAVTYPEIIGDLAIKEWIDEEASAGFVRRHYEINPVAGDTTINRRITLYFTQDDFDTYNTLAPENALKLPTDSTDTTGMSNLLIEYHKGISSDFETGSPETYEGNPTKILPTAIVPHWIGSLNRWSVSFETKGFGGFFLKSQVLTNPDSVVVSKTSVCEGDSVSLTAYCAFGTVSWYSAFNGARIRGDVSTPIGTGSPLVIAPTPDTIYLASCNYNDNESGKIATTEITINPLPASPTEVSVSNTAICNGTSVSLTATCATGTITWYDQETGGSAIGAGSPLSKSPSANTTYYASCKGSNCESSREGTEEVVVTTIPTSPTSVLVNKTAICEGTTVSLTATCASGSVEWFTESTGGNPINYGSPSSDSPLTTTTYYASCVTGDCASARVATSKVVVTAIPSSPSDVSVDNTAICNGTEITLTANCVDGTVKWYTEATGGTSIGSGSEFIRLHQLLLLIMLLVRMVIVKAAE